MKLSFEGAGKRSAQETRMAVMHMEEERMDEEYNAEEHKEGRQEEGYSKEEEKARHAPMRRIECRAVKSPQTQIGFRRQWARGIKQTDNQNRYIIKRAIG